MRIVHRVGELLGNGDFVMDTSSRDKSELFLVDAATKKGFDVISENRRKGFVNDITQGDGVEVIDAKGTLLLGDEN